MYMRRRMISSSGICVYAEWSEAAMFGEAEIRALMRARGWRQTELAAEARVTQPTVSRWLAGQVPDPAAQERLAQLAAAAPSGGPGAPKAGYVPPPTLLGER